MSCIEDMMKKMMKRFDVTYENVKEMRNDLSGIGQKVDAHAVSIKKLEQQMKTLPTIVNPLTTQGGKQTNDPPMLSEVEAVVERNDDEIKVTGESKSATEIGEVEITHKVVPMPRPPPPFPQRLVKKTKEGKYRRFITMLKQLSFNVPLIEALEQMLGYAKLMKDLVTKKRAVSFENDERFQYCNTIATRSMKQESNLKSVSVVNHIVE
uniref:Integrase core domain containing protein n=1 Tax=Solanum tuberosum TaxID=4113 RepID=M1DEX2_SOLTU